MDLRQIRYFAAIRDTQSILGAARLLNISQPALSKRLRDLETSLGEKLFDRHARGMTLTDAGRRFAVHAADILAAVDRASKDFGQAARREDHVAIGATPTPSRFLLPPLLAGAREVRPPLRISAHQGSNQELFDLLARRELDAILCYATPRYRNIAVHALYREDCFLIGRPDGMARFGDAVEFETAAAVPLVLDPHSHVGRRQIDQIARRKKLKLDIVAEIEPWDAKKLLMRDHACFAILPYASCLEEVRDGSLAASRIIHPALSLTLNLILPASLAPRTAQRLQGLVASVVKQRVAERELRWQKV